MGVVSRSWDGGVNAGKDPAELRHALGVPIMPKSLERALTHRSYAYENDNPPTNERLEFLGDSVLGLVVTDTLFRGYPNLPEGQLAKLRAAVVQMSALAEVARELSLGDYVRLGRGEQVTGGRNKPSILADTLEAVIGAVYIDCGLAEASALVHRLFDPVIAKSARLGAGLDWKTSLQELTAVKMLGVPEYQVEESGPDHQKSFRAVVRVGGRVLGSGEGRTKKAAEQQAAEAAWRAITARGQRRPEGRQGRRRRTTGKSPRRSSEGMPELPEVETVRRGLEHHVVGRTIAAVRVLHPRAVRRQPAGPAEFESALAGRSLDSARRRGKYLWLSVGEDALLAHLGMSGQLLVVEPDRPLSPHVRIWFTFSDGGPDLRFTDQRTFGHMCVVRDGAELPAPIAHIAPDPFEAAFDPAALARRLRSRRTGVKRALLDQSLVSGVGNIYADEALWRARLHWARPTETLNGPEVSRLLAAVREVLGEALVAGGTSFDDMYVNVNGESGYFDRSLAVYGREGFPCLRCGTPVRRDPFMNRSAYSCPRCQPRPRRARW